VPPGQLPPRLTATQDNFHLRQLPPQRCGRVGTYSQICSCFFCNAMKVNTSITTYVKMSLKCCWKWLLVQDRYHTSFFSTAPGQLPPRTMRFTHRIQAINFSLVYRVEAGMGVLAAQRLRTSVLRYYCINIVQQNLVATLLLLTCNSQIKS